MDKTFSPSYSPSQITYAEAVGISRFRFHRKRTASAATSLVGGCRFFCESHHKWKSFRPPWRTLSGLGPKLLDGSISLKFLLETRLQSESFDTLDDC